MNKFNFGDVVKFSFTGDDARHQGPWTRHIGETQINLTGVVMSCESHNAYVYWKEVPRCYLDGIVGHQREDHILWIHTDLLAIVLRHT